MIVLVPPSIAYQWTYIRAMQECVDSGEFTDMPKNVTHERFYKYVNEELKKEKYPAEDRVPEIIRWAVDERMEYIGEIHIRPVLNDALRRRGGHIGLFVRPSMRRQGHGKYMLAEAIKYVRRTGVPEILLTCDTANIASYRTIKSLRMRMLEQRVMLGETETSRFTMLYEKLEEKALTRVN